MRHLLASKAGPSYLGRMLRVFTSLLASVVSVSCLRLLRGPSHPRRGLMLDVTVRAVRRVIGQEPERFVDRLRSLPPGLPPRSLASRVRIEDATFAGIHTTAVTPEGWKRDVPTCLFAHGGGYVSGSSRHVLDLTVRLALATGHRVVSIDYRLAPEHPFPAALDDALAAWDALSDDSDAPIWVSGDSAGAGLVLALCIRLRNAERPLPACIVGFSPFVDVSRSAVDAIDDSLDFISPALLSALTEPFAGKENAQHPCISPVFASLSGLPPMWVSTGGAELLKPEQDLLVERARTAGVQVEQVTEEGMPHNYAALAAVCPEGQSAIDQAAQFVHLQASSKSHSNREAL